MAGAVSAVALSPNAQTLVSGGDDATIRFWNQANGQPTDMFGGHAGPVTTLAFNPGSTQLLSASADGSVRVWDCFRLEKKRTNRQRLLHYQGSKLTALTFLENSHVFASASSDGSLHICKVEVVAGASHFFVGRTDRLTALARGFVDRLSA